MTPLEKSTRSCNMFWSPPPTTPFTKPQLHVIVPSTKILRNLIWFLHMSPFKTHMQSQHAHLQSWQ